MSDGLDLVTGGPPPGGRARRPAGHRRAAPKAKSAWPKRIIALAVVAALLFGGWWAVGEVRDRFSGVEDFSGQGTGEVVVEIPEGATGQQIANVLFDAGVTASPESFYQLSLVDERASMIQPGFYNLREEMSAEAALDALSNPDSRVESQVTVREGARLPEIAEAISEGTEIPIEDVEAAYDNPDALGLPEEANGNPEGFLYPATYTVQPGTTAEELLSQMVAQTVQVETDLDIEARAAAVGLTKTEVMTLASILEYEANTNEDYPKVARVFLNRLDQGIALQSDATVAYANNIVGDVWTTEAERNNPSPYNTYYHQGLPPGPIGAAGETTIEAVLNPEPGDWLYFVPDYENETTVFSNNLADHQAAADRLAAWCRDDAKDVDDIC